MSDAWREPVTVWTEPTSASVMRVAARGLLAGLWATAALFVPWPWVSALFYAFAALAFLHAVLAIANLARNKGVLLRLTGSGTLEWPQSYQEILLRRPPEWVDGKQILVVELSKMGVPSRVEPRVTLKGATHDLPNLPLYRASVADFVKTVNEVLAERGMVFQTERLR
ncbi:MAG: hypothetical protein CVT68_09180 [Actinobacteria bacterium HGW-Actinobacteria-8]|nr:MAG: hypothetical protein CVT68_09180 [Actinobacteria bacterium HGW-Actinobacteria-8]